MRTKDAVTINSLLGLAALSFGLLPTYAHASLKLCNNTPWTVKMIWYRGSETQSPCPNNFEIRAWKTLAGNTCSTVDNGDMNGIYLGWWAVVLGGSNPQAPTQPAPAGRSHGSPGSSSGEQWYPFRTNFDACYNGDLFGNQSLCQTNWPNDGNCVQLVGSMFKQYTQTNVTANLF